MSKTLKFSILLNATLIAGLAFTWIERSQPLPPAAPPVQSAAPSPAIAAAFPASKAEPVPWRWSQLDAPDYHLYVKNLRAVGCPEPTLYAIVAADVHAACQEQVRILKTKLKDLASSPGFNGMAALDAETKLKSQLREIPDWEAAEVVDLLGLKPVPVVMAVNDSSSEAGQVVQADDERPAASMPMAFQNIDVAALGLDEDQLQAITSLRQRFVDQVGGTNQDPNDPAYLARWQQAQPGADSMLRQIMGNQTYAQYQVMQLKQTQMENSATTAP